MTSAKQPKEPQADETTGKGSPELVGRPGLPTPGQAEGDTETVEENLQHKARSQRSGGRNEA